MTRMQSRQVDPLEEIGRLEKRHLKLKERVAEFESRRFLSGVDQQSLTKLKKEKLATKDAIETLRSG